MPDSTCEVWWHCSTCKQCKTLLPIHGAIHSTAVQSTHKLFSMWSISAVSIATAAPLLHCRYGIWPQSHSNWTRFWTKVPYATGLWAFKVLQQLAFPGETDPKFSIVKVPNKFMDNKVVKKKIKIPPPFQPPVDLIGFDLPWYDLSGHWLAVKNHFTSSVN